MTMSIQCSFEIRKYEPCLNTCDDLDTQISLIILKVFFCVILLTDVLLGSVLSLIDLKLI